MRQLKKFHETRFFVYYLSVQNSPTNIATPRTTLFTVWEIAKIWSNVGLEIIVFVKILVDHDLCISKIVTYIMYVKLVNSQFYRISWKCTSLDNSFLNIEIINTSCNSTKAWKLPFEKLFQMKKLAFLYLKTMQLVVFGKIWC